MTGPSSPCARRPNPTASRKPSRRTPPTRTSWKPPCGAWEINSWPKCARTGKASARSPSRSATTTWMRSRPARASTSRRTWKRKSMREISRLLRKAWKRRVSLRLVSLKLSNLYDGRFRGMLALDAAARQHEAQQRLADVVDALREKYGRGVVLRGHDFILRAQSRTGVSPVQHPQLARPPSAGVKCTCVGVCATASAVYRAPPAKLPDLVKTAEAVESPCASPSTSLKRRLFNEQRTRQAGFQNTRHSRFPEPSFDRSSSLGPPSTTYIPLNVHSYYSFLDSTLSSTPSLTWPNATNCRRLP